MPSGHMRYPRSLPTPIKLHELQRCIKPLVQLRSENSDHVEGYLYLIATELLAHRVHHILAPVDVSTFRRHCQHGGTLRKKNLLHLDATSFGFALEYHYSDLSGTSWQQTEANRYKPDVQRQVN